MPSLISHNSRIRKNYAKLKPVIDFPNLVEIQRESFKNFLQVDKAPPERVDVGLHAVFKSVFPIEDFDRTASLEFEKYILEKPKYTVDECRQRGMTYAAPITVTVRLVVWDVDEDTETRSIRDIKEQDVYLGEIPLMTETGSFIINGTERVVVSQLHRSPGVFYDHDSGKTHSSGKLLYSARIIPYRGSWIDFEFDHKDLIHVRIDRRRKMPATVLLKALGYSTQELLDYFYNRQTITVDGKKFCESLELDMIEGLRSSSDIKHPKTKKVIVKRNRKFTSKVIEELRDANVTKLEIEPDHIIGKVSATDLPHPKTGELILEVNEKITEEKLNAIQEAGIKSFQVLYIDNLNVGSYLSDTVSIDKITSQDEAMIEIYRRLRPGDPPTLDTARNFFENLFFNPARYDLSKVGRLKLNHKFDLNVPLDMTVLTKKDIMEVVRYLIDLKNGKGTIDDIDHLGNRRVRCVGELLENQYRIGLVRMERAIKERMSLQDVETLMPHDLINAKPISAVIKEFFGSSQLSQFMDQTNPLSEITHKRRLSALGPGGLTRDRAGFEVRDVHSTHYGRICPIETPEGPNIGLISSLTTYARVNPYGFIETPYRKVLNNKVGDEIIYLSALQEERHSIAQANAPLTEKKTFADESVSSRKKGDFQIVRAEEVDLMDVSPAQLVSVAAALIPFLQNDDANRALMGSNMQRQAVPLLKAKAPLIGTGMEAIVARDSGVTVVARKDGVIEHVDANRIVVRSKRVAASGAPEVEIYNLVKYRQSNQNTCINQVPIIRRGDVVKAGQVIADGPATEIGELALGQNVLVAFMPWGGYNFEDSILVSERLTRDDTFTSIHIESFECVARDTKLGKEDVTRDIPNVGEEALRDLDNSGIIRIGAEVKPNDVLVGKVTPKGETQLSPEEKLLRAIFGEKAGDVRDTSLRVPSGVVGTVINAQVFSREGAEKDERAKQILEEEINHLLKDQAAEINIIKRTAMDRLRSLLVGATTTGKVLSEEGSDTLLKKGETITEELLSKIGFDLIAHIPLETKLEQEVSQIVRTINDQIDVVKMTFQERIHKLQQGDELPPGVIKMVKVYVAIKRKLQVGDKMAGRHGNKGVVSRVLPIEDMPYLDGGTAVDIVLNPLGVPSRMNVGQILETHLGWAAKGIGEQINSFLEQWNPTQLRKYIKQVYSSPAIDKMIDDASEDELRSIARQLKGGIHISTPVFDGASEAEIHDFLNLAKLPRSGQATLFDGRTGEAFDKDVTVGEIYMMKLHHLVEDKIHARSIGPYSLVTQQPLGGKAQFGGQRLGEMEVWALEAYGAAFALQEFLTVKSDDVAGRTRIYESIVKGENELEPGLPESFNVLIKELQALSLDITLVETPTE